VADRLDDDLRLALLTGAAGWRDRNSSYTPAELAVLAVLVSTIVAVVSVLLLSAGLPAHDAALTGAFRWLAAVGAALILVAGVAPTLAWPFGWRPRRSEPLRRMAVLRVTAAMVVVGCWTGLMGPVASVTVWPLGGVVGCECLLTAWALGVEASGASWWWRFQRSSIHAGVVLVCVVAVALDPDEALPVLGVLLTFQVIALAAGLTCHGLVALRDAVAHHDARLRTEVAAEAHGRLAYWLHNAVTTPLRHLRLQAQAGRLGTAEVAAALADHEHALRRRQLDEELATGTVQVAELLQLQVRRAEDQGVRVVAVPRFDDAPASVEGEVGRVLQRALDVLVPNAIAAGATELGFAITAGARAVAVEVTDDAGGFDLAEVPAGRALDSLRRDLGPGGVTVTPTGSGSRVRVVITGRGATTASSPSAEGAAPEAVGS
jgi:hypothetical protein